MRKKLAVIMAALILNISIMTTAVLPTQAMALNPLANGFYETFSRIFGYSWGMYKEYYTMNYNETMNNMQTFVDKMLGREPFELDNETTVSDLHTKSGMLNFIDTSLDLLHAYNSAKLTNTFYQALNDQSYSSSGTLATETMEENLIKAREMVDNINEGDYTTAFDTMAESLFAPQESGAAISGIGINYKLFEAIQTGIIANSVLDENNTWFEPVENSAFNVLDLYSGIFNWNGNDIKYYKFKTISFYEDNGFWAIKYSFDNPVIFMCFNDTGFKICDVPFTGNFVQYLDGNYNYSGNISSTEYYKGFYYEVSMINSYDNLYVNPYNYAEANQIFDAFLDAYGKSTDVDNVSNGMSVSEKNPELTEALDEFWNKELTVDDVVNLADSMSQVQNVAGTEEGLKTLTDIITGITTTLPDSIVDGKNDVVKAVEGLGETILTLPKAIWLEFEGVLESIRTKSLDITKPWEGDNNSHSSDLVVLLNGLLLLIMIILALLRIFIHCLQFIINIFAIPASTAFLPAEMIMGLDYIKTLDIPGIGLSVYDFMMGLVYIFIVFFAIRLLRVNIDRIRVPKQRSGGLN